MRSGHRTTKIHMDIEQEDFWDYPEEGQEIKIQNSVPDFESPELDV